ncbi:MAG: DNA internalization-related competence protein ComEC/Rec2 [Lachnospiraceae bacterium]
MMIFIHESQDTKTKSRERSERSIKNIVNPILGRRLCCCCLIILLVQFLRTQISGADIPVMISNNAGKTVQITGLIYKKEVKSKYQILYLKQSQLQSYNQRREISNILVYDYTFMNTKLGNSVQVWGELGLFQEARNPGNFDQRFYYAKQGIDGFVKASEIKVVQGDIDELAEFLAQFRAAWSALLKEGAGEEVGGILDSILLGDKSSMDGDVKELYQKTGIGHILAISGLHVSFIGMGMYRILRKIGLPVWLAGAIGSAILWLYLLMIGCPVSALRAVIMYSLRIGALITGRRYDAATALALAAAVIVVKSPLYLWDAGFLLSFGAILGIIWVLPLFKMIWPNCPKWADGIHTSLAVNAILYPILLYFYFEFPLYSIFLNFIVIPLMSVVMAGAVAGSALWLIVPAVGGLILKGCGLLFNFYEWLCTICLELPLSRLVIGCPALWRILLYFLVLVGIYVYLMLKKGGEDEIVISMKAWALLLICFVVPLIMLGGGHGNKGELKVAMLDVGQGDGIFLQGPDGKTYFVDGGSSDVNQVGKYRIEPYLKSQGVGSLDYVFISHGDTDHMNGIEEMLTRQAMGVAIKNLVLPPVEIQDEALKKLAQTAVENGVAVYIINPGDVVSEEELEIQCIQPSAEYTGEIGNGSSMVLSVSFKAFDMLFTGDVEGEGETLLKKNLTGNQYDVLKVAHHGSKNSSDLEVLEQISPSYGLISAGVNNSYGHPHDETLERLEECGCVVYSTQEFGAITVWTSGEAVSFEVYCCISPQS